MLSSSRSFRPMMIRAALFILSGIILLFGLYFIIFGAELAWLNGSWYYVLCGIPLTASGGLMMRRSPAGAWLYLFAWAVTIPWTIYEVGFDWWGWVPRLLGPTLLALLVIAFLPFLYRRRKEASHA